MHAVKDGPADRSFGLQVAALAGLPRSVVAQAKRTLSELEARAALHGETMSPAALDSPQQMGLFAPPSNALIEALEELDPDQLTPRQALEALYRLRALRP
jgi:DNA mismatch repair protein MutS